MGFNMAVPSCGNSMTSFNWVPPSFWPSEREGESSFKKREMGKKECFFGLFTNVEEFQTWHVVQQGVDRPVVFAVQFFLAYGRMKQIPRRSILTAIGKEKIRSKISAQSLPICLFINHVLQGPVEKTRYRGARMVKLDADGFAQFWLAHVFHQVNKLKTKKEDGFLKLLCVQWAKRSGRWERDPFICARINASQWRGAQHSKNGPAGRKWFRFNAYFALLMFTGHLLLGDAFDFRAMGTPATGAASFLPLGQVVDGCVHIRVLLVVTTRKNRKRFKEKKTHTRVKMGEIQTRK